MKEERPVYPKSSAVSRYRLRRVLYIAIFWLFIDVCSNLLDQPYSGYPLLIREVLVFIMSFIMGYLFVFTLRHIFQYGPLWINFLSKSFIILFSALFMNFLVHLVEHLFVDHFSLSQSIQSFFNKTNGHRWLLRQTIYWVIIFVVTQLYIEINDKYSPGVFTDILLGKYMQPKNEYRIVMFIDLKDSTNIAEKLGNELNFFLIRDFIFDVSMAVIEQNGIIYQYVGDEVVVSWEYNDSNMKACISAVLQARKNIQKKGERYRRKYNEIPQFRVGVHVGVVSIGEIGVIKKDLAMSGDAMNVTARMKSAASQVNHNFIASKEFIDKGKLKDFQTESLGLIELKGKSDALELFALKI